MLIVNDQVATDVMDVCRNWYDGYKSEMYKVQSYAHRSELTNLKKLKKEIVKCISVNTIVAERDRLQKALEWCIEQIEAQDAYNNLVKAVHQFYRTGKDLHELHKLIENIWRNFNSTNN